MKSTVFLKSNTQNNHSSKPFFNTDGKAGFFSRHSEETEKPFFTPYPEQPKSISVKNKCSHCEKPTVVQKMGENPKNEEEQITGLPTEKKENQFSFPDKKNAKNKGEGQKDEFKVKGNSTVRFSTIQSNQLPADSVEGKRKNCPPASPAPQRHRRLNSTAAQIAAMGAGTWGITMPDNLGIYTETCRDGANWRLNVTLVNSVIRTHSRLLAGQREPIPGVNTTSANFCDQVTELDDLGLGHPLHQWYMIRAVRAHEDVHIDEWRDNFDTDWNPLEAAIEGLSVPASGATATKAAATTALRSDPVFQNARDTTNGGGNFPTFWGIPDPNANTDAAERAVVDPRIQWICKRAQWDGWNPAGCPVCSALGFV